MAIDSSSQPTSSFENPVSARRVEMISTPRARISMITGLNWLKHWMGFKNGGGMATNVPQVSRELRKLGYEVLINQPKGGFDILHIHNPLFASYFLASKTRGRKPVVIHARHIPELLKGGVVIGDLLYRPFRWYSRFLYGLADVVVCATPYVREFLVKEGIKPRMEVVPNGVNRSVFRNSEEGGRMFRDKHGFEEDDFIVLSVGLTLPRKGVRTFIEVARGLENEGVKFLWVGSSESFLQKADLNGIPSNAVFMGHLPFSQMPDAYSASDAFFFPTYAESYGNALFEAASCGKPLIIRDIPIYQDLFLHGENCLKGSSDKDFTSHVADILKDDRLRRDLEKGSLRTAEEHDMGRCAVELARVYEGLLC